LDAAVGIHPHVAKDLDEATWREIVALAQDPAVVAIGETGLDYDRGFSPRDAQLEALRRHIELALETDRPVILHCRSRPGERDAHDHMLGELARATRAPKAVLHSFSGPVDYAQRAVESGAYVSFSGLVFRAGEEASAEVGRIASADRIMVETDSPYLSPPGASKRRNEPRWVALTAMWLAQQRGMDADSLGEMLVANYDRVFGRQR
jgi:TatD DNase family protein